MLPMDRALQKIRLSIRQLDRGAADTSRLPSNGLGACLVRGNPVPFRLGKFSPEPFNLLGLRGGLPNSARLLGDIRCSHRGRRINTKMVLVNGYWLGRQWGVVVRER